jgi:hypothetical protein
MILHFLILLLNLALNKGARKSIGVLDKFSELEVYRIFVDQNNCKYLKPRVK